MEDRAPGMILLAPERRALDAVRLGIGSRMQGSRGRGAVQLRQREADMRVDLPLGEHSA